MIHFKVYNVATQVYGAEQELHSLLSDKLSYLTPNYFFAPRYKSGDWDGRTRLYLTPTENREFGKFWTGLLHTAVSVLDDHGIDYHITDSREVPGFSMAIPMPLDYLRESLVGAEEAVRLKTRGLVEIPTGGGKTRLAAKILATLNIPSVFIVHRDTIFRQSVAEFKKMGVPIGIIKGAKKNIETINVATIQTLHSVMKNSYESPIRSFVLNECQAIIVDEAHHAGSPMYKYVLQRFVNAYYRVGLSATPHRHEEKANPSTDMQVQGTFGRIIYSVPKQELQDKKALVPARVFYI